MMSSLITNVSATGDNDVAMSTPSPPGDTLSSGINISLGTLAFLLNLGSLLLVALSKSLPSRQKVVFISIILTDMGTGFQIMLVRSLHENYTSHDIRCHIRLYAGVMLVYATIFSNFLITSERLLALLMPLNTSITWQKTFACALVFWIISPIITFSTFYDGFTRTPTCHFFITGNPIGYCILGIVTWVVFIYILAIYIYIAKITRRHIRQIASAMVGGASTNDGRRYLHKAELRSTVTVGVIVGCFAISYVPIGTYGIYNVLYLNDPGTFSKTNNKIVELLINFCVPNCMINPFLYIWRLRNCRQEMVDRILCRSRVMDSR